MKRLEPQLKTMNLESVTSSFYSTKRYYETIKNDFLVKRENDITLTRKRRENERLLKNMELSYNVSINGSYINLANDVGMIRDFLCVDRDKIIKELEINKKLFTELEQNIKIVSNNLLKSEIEYIYCMMSHLPNEIERHIIEWV